LDDLNALVAPAIGAIVVALAVVCAVLLVLVLVLFRRVSAAEQRFAGVTRGESGRSLEEVLSAHLDRVEAMGREVDELTARTAITEAAQRRSFQRIGLVRFNPFEDTGGNQSFALALLDQSGDGFVVSSLHARAGTRVYGKAISKGTSESNLSAEESEALRLALAMGVHPANAQP
jgi:predicted signal transduction protein with EAL and GGDEF domain